MPPLSLNMPNLLLNMKIPTRRIQRRMPQILSHMAQIKSTIGHMRTRHMP